MPNKCVQLCTAVVKPLLLLLLVVAILPLIPNLPPNHKFSPRSAPLPPALENKLSINTVLNKAEMLFEGDIIGPEGFAILNGELYTTLHGGFVVKIDGNNIKPVVKFGEPCEHRFEESKCGRPLGIFAGPDDLLYIADAYYGLFTYDVQLGTKVKLFGPEVSVAGRSPKLINSVTVSSDGIIYWTDSTSDVTLLDGLYSLLADGTGRLVKYEPKTKTHTVLIDDLVFANGVALAPDESFVVVAETGMSRVHRYWLKGSKAGQSDIFADHLPGLPDNLRAGSKGFLVSLVVAVDDSTPQLLQSIYPFPYLRKALSRALAIVELGFSIVDSHYPNDFCKKSMHFIGHFEMSSPLTPPRVTLVILDLEGNVVDSLHAMDGSVSSISDAIVYRGAIYLGSPFNNYLGQVKNPEAVVRLQKAFPVAPKLSVRVKPTPTTTRTTTPKPRSTTPKPPTTTTTQSPSVNKKPSTTSTVKPPTAAGSPKAATTTQRPATTAKPPITTERQQKPTATTPQPPTASTKTTPKPPASAPKPTGSSPPKPRTTTAQTDPNNRKSEL